jgi:hypothetical protein
MNNTQSQNWVIYFGTEGVKPFSSSSIEPPTKTKTSSTPQTRTTTAHRIKTKQNLNSPCISN